MPNMLAAVAQMLDRKEMEANQKKTMSSSSRDIFLDTRSHLHTLVMESRCISGIVV